MLSISCCQVFLTFVFFFFSLTKTHCPWGSILVSSRGCGTGRCVSSLRTFRPISFHRRLIIRSECRHHVSKSNFFWLHKRVWSKLPDNKKIKNKCQSNLHYITINPNQVCVIQHIITGQHFFLCSELLSFVCEWDVRCCASCVYLHGSCQYLNHKLNENNIGFCYDYRSYPSFYIL